MSKLKTAFGVFAVLGVLNLNFLSLSTFLKNTCFFWVWEPWWYSSFDQVYNEFSQRHIEFSLVYS